MCAVNLRIQTGCLVIRRATAQFNKSLQATRDGGSSSAVAVQVFASRVPELWSLGGVMPAAMK